MLVRPAESRNRLTADPALAGALVVALAGTATIAGAWFFELVIGLAPCPLCLEQRWPYYIGIPVAAATALAARRGAPRGLVAAGLAAVGLIFLYGAGLATYHAGVEWKWWLGPQACAGAPPAAAGGNLLQQLQTVTLVRCDEIPWQFLGLSLAGWNALISAGLAAVALIAAAASVRTPAR